MVKNFPDSSFLALPSRPQTPPITDIPPADMAVLPCSLSDGALENCDPTTRYLADLNVTALARQGVDYRHPRFGISDLKPLKDLDIVYDYRFDRLEDTRRRLEGIDRPRVLRHIFDSVTACAESETDILLRVVWFVHMNMFPNIVQAMWTDRLAVFDPLILLELSEYRCGCSARLVLDILEAGTDWPSRLLLLGSHVVAEVFFDDGWHLVEPSYFPDGVYPCLEDGRIPSFQDLERKPELIDRLPFFLDPATDRKLGPTGDLRVELHTPRRSSVPYLSRLYFAAESYATRPLEYLTKHKTGKLAGDRHYGWLSYSLEKAAHQPRLKGMDRWIPSAPQVTDIHVERRDECRIAVTLRWEPSVDGDDDIVNYRVMIGSRSRQWNYPSYDGPACLAHLVSSPHPNPLIAYRGQLALPPHDLIDAVTSQTCLTCELAVNQTIYISVCAQDSYGLAIGRQQFYPDTEFAVQL
jgi:hypothetical protein